MSWRKNTEWSTWFEQYGFGGKISMHSEKPREQRDFFDQPCIWNTYLLFSDKLRFSKHEMLCEPYAEPDPLVSFLWDKTASGESPLHGLEGWNGGVTHVSKKTDAHGIRYITIGDDYAHLWDVTDRRFELYSLEYMQRQVDRLAREANDVLRLLRRPA